MIFDLSITQFSILGTIVFLAAFVQANLGVGFSFVAAPFIPFIEPELVPVSVLILGFFSSTTISYQGLKYAIWREIRLSLLGRVVGTLLAYLLLLIVLSTKIFIIIYCLMILVSVALSIIRITPAFNPKNLFFASILSGLFGTISSVGGPPMAIIYQNRDPDVAKYNLSILFSVGTLLSLLAIYFVDRLNFRNVLSAFLLLPFCFFGIMVAKYFVRLSSNLFRNILLIVAGSGALVLLLKTSLSL